MALRLGIAVRSSVLCALVLFGCDGTSPPPIDTPMCTPRADTEGACRDGVDDDCDGYTDCLDTECEGQAVGDCTCTAGACVVPCEGEGCVPELPRLENVRVDVRGDTAVIEFEPVAEAVDYRIYPMPALEDILIGSAGEVVVRNAIYRCAGMRVNQDREVGYGVNYEASLSGMHSGYTRSEAESILGYVYITPGAGRLPVYRVADPNGGGGFFNADWVVPIYAAANSADYVVGEEARDALIAMGWRDDGVAFYAPEDGDLGVHRATYEPDPWEGSRVSRLYADGPEAEFRDADTNERLRDLGNRFSIYAAQREGTVALHRVSYSYGSSFDVLAAGEGRYQRILHQDGPVDAVTWPGITETTVFVVEALDAGCPFPNGYIAHEARPADTGGAVNAPSITLDQARLASGEVFINGQHDPNSRPRPIARAYVEVTPEAHPEMDFYETFSEPSTWEGFEEFRDNNGFSFRNANWAVDTGGCSDNFTFGPVLGQLFLGFTDYGSSCNISITPKNVESHVSAGSFLHVRMSTDIPSTGRRYPQLMITTASLVEPDEVGTAWQIPIHNRLGPLPFEEGAPPGTEQSIIVQPFGGYQELQVQLCDQRGWGVNVQCPQANLYGDHAGNYEETWEEPWTPVPVLGELSGYDRPVQFDVWASTERVYVYLDGRPAGCAVLPAGRVPAGDVTVVYRAVMYHSGIDETVTPEDTGHVFERNYSLMHSDRRMDDFGIDNDVPPPAWDESVLPCGTRWYGG